MSSEDSETLISHLKEVLLTLHSNPYPDVANPPEAPRRASVALILRIQPSYNHWPSIPESKSFLSSQHPHAHQPHHSHADNHNPPRRRRSSTTKDTLTFKSILDAFFAQPWVQHGTPEILFIKRATRKGDKWTGHVALPGGKRDPEDDSDAVTAVREALEEVGIDLSYTHALAAGNLPQRVVTTSWGKVPLMVLCPYVYLLTSPEYPAQRLQPDEVASSHWVPLKALLSPELRTYEYADVSARLAKSELGIKKWFLQAMLSKMMFAAIHLIPSNSTYCPTIPGFIPPTSSSGSPPSSSANLPFFLTNPESSATQAAKHPPPLLLWGLTLGVVSDFLEHIPPHNALELWTYPTFTSPDVRLWMWALSYRFRKRKAAEMSSAALANSLPPSRDEGAETFKAGEAGEGSIAVHPEPLLSNPELPVAPEKPGEVGIAGLGCGRHWGRRARNKMIARGAAVNGMLEGYYPIVRKAVAVALICRVLMVGGLGWWTWRRGVWQGIGRALGGLGIVWRSGVVV